jgi:hypothetical protein
MLGVSTNVGGALAQALIGLREVVDTQKAGGAKFTLKKQFGRQHCIFGNGVKSIINDASHANLHYGRLGGLKGGYARAYKPFLDVIYKNIHQCMLKAMGQQPAEASAEVFVEMMHSRPHEEEEGQVQTHTRIKDTNTNSTSEPTSGSNSADSTAVEEAAEEEKREESEEEQTEEEDEEEDEEEEEEEEGGGEVMDDDNNGADDEGPDGHRDHRNTEFGVNRHQVPFPMHASPHSACH